MKMAFISDIHGNAVALDAVLKDIHSLNVDSIAVLGDVCYRGPEPKKTLDRIRSLHCPVIKGNADEWVVRGVREGEVPEQARTMMNAERDWTVSQLDEDDLNYLEQLPHQFHWDLNSCLKLHTFHATPESLFDVVMPQESPSGLNEKLMVEKDADLYLYGHIHLPYVRYVEGKCLANLGSVGLPFDGQSKASYVVVEADEDRFRVSIERVPYDVEKVAEQYADYGYPNAETMQRVVREAQPPS
ncbi:metallophosphoesterase family protein [Natribacillus halophilus]|uniref:Phosphoesterase, MJ0936 family n=1 Tax=Natribacillus halophilus TaxID=549003 RepID=A0A1G8M7G4_9BACI|nr:metallophosphoesterase family protein [Natribacillus halophilus]SDI63906.1 phosphoesterase, MJ0936 family [Natribacillus halophilus]